MRVLSFFLVMLAALASLLAGGEARAQLGPGEKAMDVRLAAETSTPAAGETIKLILKMTPKQTWHGYWKNPGDAGVPMRIDWSLPKGVAVGEPAYPVPDRLMISGIMNYVYEGPYALLIDMKVPEGAPPGAKLPLRATIDYLVCTKEICVPETAKVALDLSVASRPQARQPIDAALRALPKPLGSKGTFERRDGKLRIAFPIPASLQVTDPYFFPETDGALQYSAPQSVSRNGDRLIVEVAAAGGAPPLVQGVLRIGKDLGLSASARPGAVPAAGASADAAANGAPAGVTLLGALAGALIGGLLLNIMPCVFPILSLKALSLAKVGGDEAGARREAVAYSAGAILVCLALGALLLALRAGGAAVGWAFQLQDPRVIAFLLLLVTAISLNLAGLFELPALGGGDRLTRKEGLGGAFWTGALAAFVATPCTGPFMGAALGAALVLSTPAALAVFAGLGLGVALPFLAIGFLPALRRRLPRPGPWMGRFRRLMSLPMFLTALALAWVLGRQSGTDGMALGLAAALILALALWWVGRKQGQGRAWLPLAPAALAAAAVIIVIPTAAPPAAAKEQGKLAAQPFSEQRLTQLKAEGRPVFVYFTADWCVTCKVNEGAAIEQEEVASAFAAGKVAVLVGDWTRGDPAIGRFLEKHGRTGVPLYLYYAPGKPVQILPQVLTTSRLTALVA
jgi:thiol:disulfide interchange protein/DsbC/DsbD-like thiol-disulfide interchange protein